MKRRNKELTYFGFALADSMFSGACTIRREPIEVDAESFIGVKGYKAIGKRITTLHIGKVEELEPTRFPEIKDEPEDDEGNEGGAEAAGTEDEADPFDGKSQQDVADEMNGQLRLDF